MALQFGGKQMGIHGAVQKGTGWDLMCKFKSVRTLSINMETTNDN